jgi:hypothetical protein
MGSILEKPATCFWTHLRDAHWKSECLLGANVEIGYAGQRILLDPVYKAGRRSGTKGNVDVGVEGKGYYRIWK